MIKKNHLSKPLTVLPCLFGITPTGETSTIAGSGAMGFANGISGAGTV